jgi:arylsulfatase A-like enzyme
MNPLRCGLFFRGLAVGLAAGTVLAAPRPNLLFLLTDDQRADTIRALGNRQVQTPNLDRLSREGTAFGQAHIMGALQGAVCVPSRAMILSGRSLFRVPENLRGVETWPQKLRAAGYRTFITGKWHNQAPSLLASFGEGETIFLGGMSDQFRVPVQDLSADGRLVNRRTNDAFSAALFVDSAVRFLRGLTNDQPFCLYVAFTTPHDPRTAPREFRDRYEPDRISLPPNFLPRHPFDNGELEVRDEKLLPWPRTPAAVRREIADYHASITATDAHIGRLLEALRATGRYADTLIVFAGDNGLALGSHGLLGKQNLYEHSMRVPLIVAGPGVKAGRRSEALCYLLDLAPTICELAGVPPPAGSEGISLVPILRGGGVRGRDALFTAYREVQRAVRADRWKLIEYPQIGKTQLFDLRRDPHETRDLAGRPAVAPRLRLLRERLALMQVALGDPLAPGSAPRARPSPDRASRRRP